MKLRCCFKKGKPVFEYVESLQMINIFLGGSVIRI